MREKRSWSGGTLVTIAIVLCVVVVAVLVTVVLPSRTRRRPPHMDPMEQIAMALDRYRHVFGRYPPDTGYGLKAEAHPDTCDPGSLWRYLAEEVYCKRTEFTYGPFLRDWPRKRRATYKDPTHGRSYILLDPWGNPYGFVGDRKRVVHNKRSFNLFSAGPDGRTACDEPGAEPNLAYDGIDNDGNGTADDATELGAAARNGDVGDDINNWTRPAMPAPSP